MSKTVTVNTEELDTENRLQLTWRLNSCKIGKLTITKDTKMTKDWFLEWAGQLYNEIHNENENKLKG